MSRFLTALACVCIISAAVSAQAQTDKKKKEKPAATGEVKAEEKKALPPGAGPDGEKHAKKGIDIFQAGKDKKVEAKLVQQNEKTGYLLLRNITTETLNVRFPDAFVGANQIGNGRGARVGGPGTAQSTGITVTQGRGAGQDQAGLFSIPPGKTIKLPVTSVCLEYGKPEPNSRLNYVIMPVERYSTNPVFHELLPLFTKTRASQKVAQAAAWHLSSGLSWTELTSVTDPRAAGGLPLPIFSTNDLRAAKALVDKATALAVEKRRKSQSSNKREAKPPVKKPARSSRGKKT